MLTEEMLTVFAGSFVFHSLLYVAVRRISMAISLKSYLRLSRGDQAEWDSRVVSNIQAILASIGAFRWIWIDWNTIQTDFDFGKHHPTPFFSFFFFFLINMLIG
jgi:hypothetical protein